MTPDDAYEVPGMGDPGYPRPQDYRVRRVTCWPWLIGLPVLLVMCWLAGR